MASASKITGAILIFAMWLATQPGAHGQTADTDVSARSTERLTLRFYLDRLRYDVSARGPLIVVAADEALPNDPDLPDEAPEIRLPIETIGRRSERKVVAVGGLSVLAPAQMLEIESHLGKAKLLVGLKSDEAMKLLFGTFSSAQWQAACGENGIGFEDMDEAQRQIYDVMVPDPLKILANNDANVTDRSNVRIRFNREVSFALVTEGTSKDYFGGREKGPNSKPKSWFAYPPGGGPADNLPFSQTSAYGVMLVRRVVNRQKASAIDYSSPHLDARISLGDLNAKPTVGDLVTRAVAATRLDIVADRRVRDLPVFVRGESARAGDLLQSIALGVTGTYRKIGATSTYVLTSDIDGAGARLTRIVAWMRAAQKGRDLLIANAMRNAARQNPLTYLTYAPGDPLALSASVTGRLDDRARDRTRIGLERVPTADLSPTMQAAVKRRADIARTADGVVVDPMKVGIYTGFSGRFLVPGFGIVSDPKITVPDSTIISKLVSGVAEIVKAKSSAPQEWTWMSKPNWKRVLIAAPRTREETENLISEAHQHGFNSVWLQVDYEMAGEAQTILRAGVAAGRRDRIDIGASLSLFQSAGPDGEAERTIDGQTGSEFASDYVQAHGAEPPDDESTHLLNPAINIEKHYSNWRDVDPDLLIGRAAALAAIPGLAGLVFRGAAPPGFIACERFAPDEGIVSGELGYTDSRRLAYLKKNGIDPIDVYGVSLDIMYLDLQSAYFPVSAAPKQAWIDYRVKENKQLMRDLFQRMRDSHPALPLWISDRTSDYANVYNGFFGTWDVADRLPVHSSEWNSTDSRKEAHLTSKTALLYAKAPRSALADDREAYLTFASELGSRSNAKGWDGVIIDYSEISGADALTLVRALPVAAPASVQEAK